MEEKKYLHQNRLSKEKSPYLLQHKNNPVDWFPWGDEAFEKAKKEDKPIFLSIGYSTCHWCHVMAHESFENEEIAKIMNENFVNIKVDREERPDIDKIYMTYVQGISGSGGWPLSVFLTPELTPIVGGTYFPPHDNWGRPGFPKLLKIISQEWKNKKKELLEQGERIIEILKKSIDESKKKNLENQEIINDSIIDKCYEQISKLYDEKFGGFSDAPKFPRPVIFNFLFHIIARENKDSPKGKNALTMILFTLKKMAMGGIFDHLGGGFHRYSVTEDWHIPHFEKMLYDQAQLINSYLDAYQLTNDPFFEKTARKIMDYISNTITSPEGGIYSAEDADSLISFNHTEYKEGAFYVWEMDEIVKILGEEHAKVFNYHYGVKKEGNSPPHGDPHGEFKKKNILIQRYEIQNTAKYFNMNLQECEEILSNCCKKLFEEREKRPRPHLDDKIITAWNGLMISAYSRAFEILGDRKYLESAKKVAYFIEKYLFNINNGTLIRNYREGASNIQGFADDYAFLIHGLLDLYEASFEIKWLIWAISLQEKQNELFQDEKGGYFLVSKGDKNLLLRLKEDYDGAEPSNNSVSALNLLRLYQMTGDLKWKILAEKIFINFSNLLKESPIVLPFMCVALDFYLCSPKKIVIFGKDNEEKDLNSINSEIHKYFIPNKIILFINEENKKFFQKLEYIQNMKMINEKITIYICEKFSCSLPINNSSDLKKLLSK